MVPAAGCAGNSAAGAARRAAPSPGGPRAGVIATHATRGAPVLCTHRFVPAGARPDRAIFAAGFRTARIRPVE